MMRVLNLMLIALIFSAVFLTGCKKNKSPEIPSTPSGSTSGSINTEYTFTSSAEDPNGDSVAIRFDWGDGDTSEWSSWETSGDSISLFHTWSDSGSYLIKAQAKDKNEVISDWSAGLLIVIAVAWTNTFGGSDWDAGYSVQQTSDGGYIITGTTLSYGAGEYNYNVYLIKTDGNGNEQWYKTFGGTDNDYGRSIQLTSDGGYIIVGNTGRIDNNDAYLIKTDASGNEQWHKTFSGSFGYSIQQTTDGGYIITGYTLSYGAGSEDVYLIKTDASGNDQWYKTFGGSDFDIGYSVQQTTDGGYIIAGYTGSYGAGSSDFYLIKTDANGDSIWIKIFGGSSGDYGYSVQQTSDGGYIITGTTLSYGAGSYDVYLIKTDANGNEQWYKTFGGLGLDYGHSVQQTSDGGYIIAGNTSSFGVGYSDVYLIKTDVYGNQTWYKTFGGTKNDHGFSIRLTSDGGYIITGDISHSGINADVYLIKTDANGNVN